MANKQVLFEISVPKHVEIGRKTQYQIVIITNHELVDNDCYFIHRRYSDFEKLHSQLQKEILYLPEFPSKVFWNKSKQVKNDRKSKFNTYIKYVGAFIMKNNYEETASGRAFMKFITPNKFTN